MPDGLLTIAQAHGYLDSVTGGRLRPTLYGPLSQTGFSDIESPWAIFFLPAGASQVINQALGKEDTEPMPDELFANQFWNSLYFTKLADWS